METFPSHGTMNKSIKHPTRKDHDLVLKPYDLGVPDLGKPDFWCWDKMGDFKGI